MTRQRTPKEILHRRQESQQQANKSHITGHFQAMHPSNSLLVIAKLIGTLLLWVSAILGSVSGFVALIPRVSVFQNDPINVSDPFSTPFIVINDGPLEIRDVTFQCLLINVVTTHHNSFTNVTVDSG